MTIEGKDVRAVQRLPAASGRVSYSPPIVLHESRERRIVLVPFYITRTVGTQLAVKIQSYQKALPPNDWVLIEDKSVSLNEETSRALLRGLREHLAVAKDGGDDGNYMLIRVTEGTAQLGEHDPAMVAAALTKVLSQEEILQHLGQAELSDELVKALRGAIRLKEMRAAVAELQQHLQAGQTDEGVYQRWCEEHSWAFGNAYVVRDPVRDISAGDRTDLLLPTVISRFRDIVELKRSDMDVLIFDRAHRDHYWSADVSRAIGQAHRYLDVLHEEAANGLRDHPDIVAYHPRAIIVIGRSAGWDLDRLKGLRGLNSRLNGITVMTYDQLLAQGERLLAMLSERAADTREEDAPFAAGMPPAAGPEGIVEDEDIPF